MKMQWRNTPFSLETPTVLSPIVSVWQMEGRFSYAAIQGGPQAAVTRHQPQALLKLIVHGTELPQVLIGATTMSYKDSRNHSDLWVQGVLCSNRNEYKLILEETQLVNKLYSLMGRKEHLLFGIYFDEM